MAAINGLDTKQNLSLQQKVSFSSSFPFDYQHRRRYYFVEATLPLFSFLFGQTLM
jgi:hypothetical protein